MACVQKNLNFLKVIPNFNLTFNTIKKMCAQDVVCYLTRKFNYLLFCNNFLLVKAEISIYNSFEYIFDWFTILIWVLYSNYYQAIIMHNANGF